MTWLKNLQTALEPYPWAYTLLVVLVLAGITLLVNFITKFILYRGLRKFLKAHPPAGSEEHRACLAIISRLANIIPAVVLASGASMIPGIHALTATLIRNLSSAFIVLAFSLALSRALDLLDLFYRKRPDAAERPIKGYLQLVKICVWTGAVFLMIAMLINRSPLILFSGLGAMAAVLILIFQDTILSVVAAMQISSNDMVRIGDWIEMPSQNADGCVTEIALHTIKVQNWDKTISTLPIRKLITDSFKNWRGMYESGGRRIKRSLYIDQRSVRFLEESEIRKLEEFVLLNSYLEQYLRNNHRINQEMLLLVRQLPPGVTGIPLEIYCFTRDVQWIAHEETQSDIFDHLLAILPVFGLRVFQQCSDTSGMVPLPPPSGSDWREFLHPEDSGRSHP